MHSILSVIAPTLATFAFQACSWSLYQNADRAVRYLKDQDAVCHRLSSLSVFLDLAEQDQF